MQTTALVWKYMSSWSSYYLWPLLHDPAGLLDDLMRPLLPLLSNKAPVSLSNLADDAVVGCDWLAPDARELLLALIDASLLSLFGLLLPVVTDWSRAVFVLLTPGRNEVVTGPDVDWSVSLISSTSTPFSTFDSLAMSPLFVCSRSLIQQPRMLFLTSKVLSDSSWYREFKH